MAYSEVSVVVEGAEEENLTFADDALMKDYIERIRQEAEADGYPTEVFITYHEHAGWPYSDCDCKQYETDHKPAYSWNMKDA